MKLIVCENSSKFESRHGNLAFRVVRPGKTQTGMVSYRSDQALEFQTKNTEVLCYRRSEIYNYAYQTAYLR